MKRVKWSATFTRQYKERIARDGQLKQAFQESVESFLEDKTAVNDHPLKGKMSGLRAFAINDDYRVVYLEREAYFLFIYVGTHEQVYYW